MGFGANWITDWYGYDREALSILGLRPDEKLAGFIHLGTATEPPLERVRPDLSVVVDRWG
jgi:nitroreductase